MGQCGCSEPNNGHKFPGPDGSFYVVSLYESCKDCDTPAGIKIDKYEGEDIELFCVKDLPDLEIGECGNLLSVISRTVLADKLKKYLIETAEFTVDDFISESFRDTVRESKDL